MSVEAHKKEATTTVRCKVITVSDTRTQNTDKSGRMITDLLEKNEHIVKGYKIVSDEQNQIYIPSIKDVWRRRLTLSY
jgi:molybdopterin adenylyltransferase